MPFFKPKTMKKGDKVRVIGIETSQGKKMLGKEFIVLGPTIHDDDHWVNLDIKGSSYSGLMNSDGGWFYPKAMLELVLNTYLIY